MWQSALASEPIQPSQLTPDQVALEVKALNLYYNQHQVLFDIHMRLPRKQVTAFIGPSGCGKSSLLRSFNRMNDMYDSCHLDGCIELGGENIYQDNIDVPALRRRVGMVFQHPNPFPKSIYENVVYGLRLQGIRNRRELDDIVERSLQAAGLWAEVKDRLHKSAMSLSTGQQQRLVIARAIAIEPEVLLLDEPTSALDPISTLNIEELIIELKQKYTVIIVTHNMQQAARVSDLTAFMYLGRLVEYGDTDTIFTMPERQETEDYITGRYG